MSGTAGGGTTSASRPAAILAVDVGAGTADVLLTRPGEPLENAVKLVVPSRTQVVAAQIAQATASGRTVLLTGPVMGGGASAAAMKAHLKAGLPFVATETAALTFADDLEKVRATGVRIVPEGDAHELARRSALEAPLEVRSGDLDAPALQHALALLGAEPRVGAAAVAVQDHGYSPRGSNRVFRFGLWERAVAERRPITELFYTPAETPPALTRLQAAAAQAQQLARDGPVLVADTGPAALYGAMPEEAGDAVLANAGNGHTICVVALDGRLAGVFEHHTGRLDGPGLEARLRRFLAGELHNDEVREDGGHGAVMSPEATARLADLTSLPLIATGPRRELLAGGTLPFTFAAPHGDMMLSGCFGLLRAFADRGVVPA